MKNVFFFAFLLISTYYYSQQSVEGTYQNELGETLKLNPDHTFEYEWNFDLASGWNVGRWKLENNKNIKLTVHEIMDTVKEDGKSVLSSDQTSNTITQMEFALQSITSGGQSRSLPSKKLLIRKRKLFPYGKDGKIQDKKQQSLMNGNIFSKPWFEKIK